ncbi:metal-dependent hydrolase [Halorussus caseinilyticus]|uniref:Metal-dependent hydrolase n=1 Tax=Halorussus caseinilyticus TaxID=3034025 RepID=A0ABD5WML0_9EURY|nr:metal-dependent hydrolase [Halorussus sp. DT72]
MDVLTHLFLPLTVAYAVRREYFESPWWFALAGFGLLSDFDKFLGVPGLLHSAVALLPVSLALVGTDKSLTGELGASRLAVAFAWSHLVLDVIDGGPVPVLFPLVESGVGLTYPARVVFGADPFGIAVRGPMVALRTTAPRAGFNAYGFLNGFGIASALTFAAVYLGTESASRENDSGSRENGVELQRNDKDGRKNDLDSRGDGGDR